MKCFRQCYHNSLFFFAAYRPPWLGQHQLIKGVNGRAPSISCNLLVGASKRAVSSTGIVTRVDTEARKRHGPKEHHSSRVASKAQWRHSIPCHCSVQLTSNHSSSGHLAYQQDIMYPRLVRHTSRTLDDGQNTMAHRG